MITRYYINNTYNVYKNILIMERYNIYHQNDKIISRKKQIRTTRVLKVRYKIKRLKYFEKINNIFMPEIRLN